MAVLAPEAATVVVSRHSGEVLFAEGDVRRAVPYGPRSSPSCTRGDRGSPGRRTHPLRSLAPSRPACRSGRVARACLRRSMRGSRSCALQRLLPGLGGHGPAPQAFGVWGPVLLRGGPTGVPADMTEAIGLRSTQGLSPWGMAQAYRLLAEARPTSSRCSPSNVERGHAERPVQRRRRSRAWPPRRARCATPRAGRSSGGSSPWTRTSSSWPCGPARCPGTSRTRCPRSSPACASRRRAWRPRGCRCSGCCPPRRWRRAARRGLRAGGRRPTPRAQGLLTPGRAHREGPGGVPGQSVARALPGRPRRRP